MIYSSINNDKIKSLRKLNNKKYRDETGKYLVEGEHLVREAYQNNVLEELILLENKELDMNIRISYVTESVLRYISNLDSPNGIMGVCRKKESSLSGNRIVVLDDIQDPGNLGTIIRSCVAFNVDTLVLSEGCVDLYNPKVIRSTQGMLFKLNIIVVSDIVGFVRDLKSNDYVIYSTSVNGGNSLKSIEKSSRFVIIMGNEGNGVRQSLFDLSDSYIYIDMNPSCESLNVGVATSIILYELDKQV